jgi:hypothetical protein
MVRPWLISAVALLSIGCSHEEKVETESPAPQRTSRDFTRLSAVLAGLQRPATLRLYEGLPGEFWEPELREQERARKETTQLHGYTFYKDILILHDQDSKDLVELLSSRKSYRAYRANKKCGLYQPDYDVIWDREGATTHILISVECGEVELHGPKAELHCDLSPEAAGRLGPLLARYRKNRPEPPAAG